MRAAGALPRLLPVLLLALLAACSGPGALQRDGAPSRAVDVSTIPDAVPTSEPRARYGNPDSYEVFGRRYAVLASGQGYVERGIASWYGTKFHGLLTSTREPYDMYAMTAAHKTLPLPSYARVTNLRNGRSVVVRINDRGPFVDNRLIDLSYAAATKLDIIREGTGLVEVRVLQPGEADLPPTQVAVRPPEPAPAAAAFIPAAQAAATPAAEPRMFLQVGAFASRDNANTLAERLAGALGTAIRINPTLQGERTLYRVRIGPIPTVEEVDLLSARVAGLGLDEPQVVVE